MWSQLKTSCDLRAKNLIQFLEDQAKDHPIKHFINDVK